MTSVLIKREIWTQTHTQGRMLCSDEGRDWNDASTSQEMLNSVSKPPEAKKEAWNSFFLTALKRS